MSRSHPPTDRPRVESAVLVPVYRDDAGALRLVLILRAPGGRHGGQLAFPGGRRESFDATPYDTALREAEEEIGLPRAAVECLAELPTLATRSSDIHIDPFLVRIERPAQWRPDPHEVADVLEVPIADLVRPEAQGEAMEEFPGWPGPQRITYVRVGPHRLWGASYRIARPLLPRLLAGEWPF